MRVANPGGDDVGDEARLEALAETILERSEVGRAAGRR